MTFHCHIYHAQLTKIIVHCFDAIYKSQNAPNSRFSGAPPRTPLRELTALSLPRLPSWCMGTGEGVRCPSQRTPPPIRPSGLEHRPFGIPIFYSMAPPMDGGVHNAVCCNIRHRFSVGTRCNLFYSRKVVRFKTAKSTVWFKKPLCTVKQFL